MRVNKLTIAALAVVAGLSLTACQNDDEAAAVDQSKPSVSSTEGSDDSAQGEAKEPAAKEPAAEEPAAADKCRTDELDIKAQDSTIDGDELSTVAVTFTNGGGHDCSVGGFAGVDLKTNAGTVSAERSGEQAPATVLKDGESVSFYISYPANDTGGSGVRITGLVVTPPDETKSVTLDWPGAASLPVTEGPGTPVKVGPIGSAGQGG